MKATLAGILTAGLLLVFVGCGNGVDIVHSDEQRLTAPDVDEADVADVVDGNNAFALDLYQAIREDGNNLFYSPYSIFLALSMTYAGARGETREQMANTLHVTPSQDRLHPALNALDLELAGRADATSEKGSLDLNIVNAVWIQRGYPFLSEFLDVLDRDYGAGLRKLDFVDKREQSRRMINDWVTDETEGKVEDLLQPGAFTSDPFIFVIRDIQTRTSRSSGASWIPEYRLVAAYCVTPLEERSSRTCY